MENVNVPDQEILNIIALLAGGSFEPDGFVPSIAESNIEVEELQHEPQDFYCLSVPGKAFFIRKDGKVSVTGNSLHCLGITQLYHAFNAETQCVTPSVADDIIDCCKTVVSMEDRFIDLAFEMGDIEGMTPEDIKKYIRFIANWRLRLLNLPEVYEHQEDNPLAWLQSMLSGVEHSNFFEARSTEYSKAATTGQWHGEDGVWTEFERLQNNRK